MVNLLKSFGKGILYIIGLPFFILILLLYAIYGIFLFLYMIVKAIVLFFTGRSLFEDLPEDRKAKEILHPTPKVTEEKPIEVEEKHEETPQQQTIKEEPAPEVTPQYIPPIYPSVFTPEYVPPKDEPEPKIEEEPKEEPSFREMEDKEDFLPDFLEEEKDEPIPVSSTIDKEEITEKYTPKTSVFDDFDEEDENESSNGVRIERSDKWQY